MILPQSHKLWKSGTTMWLSLNVSTLITNYSVCTLNIIHYPVTIFNFVPRYQYISIIYERFLDTRQEWLNHMKIQLRRQIFIQVRPPWSIQPGDINASAHVKSQRTSGETWSWPVAVSWVRAARSTRVRWCRRTRWCTAQTASAACRAKSLRSASAPAWRPTRPTCGTPINRPVSFLLFSSCSLRLCSWTSSWRFCPTIITWRRRSKEAAHLWGTERKLDPGGIVAYFLRPDMAPDATRRLNSLNLHVSCYTLGFFFNA